MFIVFIIITWNYMIFLFVSNLLCNSIFYDFHDSQMKLNDFQYFNDSQMKFYSFHDFRDSPIELKRL